MAKSLEGFIWVPPIKLHVATGLLKLAPEILARAKQMGIKEIDYKFLENPSPAEDEYTWIDPKEAQTLLEEVMGSRMLSLEEHKEAVAYAKKCDRVLYDALAGPGDPEALSTPDREKFMYFSPGFTYFSHGKSSEGHYIEGYYTEKFDFCVATGVREAKTSLTTQLL